MVSSKKKKKNLVVVQKKIVIILKTKTMFYQYKNMMVLNVHLQLCFNIVKLWRIAELKDQSLQNKCNKTG